MSLLNGRSLLHLAGRFSLAGLANTALGFLAIFGCMLMGMGPYLSNALGYALGLVVSFLLQRNWVFVHDGRPSQQILRFAGAVGVAYGANLAVLAGLLEMHVYPYLAQVLGAVVYTSTMFVLSTFWVFRRNDQ